MHAASVRLAFALEDSVPKLGYWLADVYGNGTVTVCVLPIDTLRAQSPPNTGSTKRTGTFVCFRSSCRFCGAA